MILYLARHGRTNYNDLGLCNADPTVDVHLTEVGEQQSKQLAEALAAKQFDCIYVSELHRTEQTAEPINEQHNVPVIIDSRLNDGKSGFEGQHYELLNDSLATCTDKWTTSFNGGESFTDIRNRVRAFLTDLQKEPYKAVVIITSLWILQAITAEIQGLTFDQSWQLDPEQGTYTELNF